MLSRSQVALYLEPTPGMTCINQTFNNRVFFILIIIYNFLSHQYYYNNFFTWNSIFYLHVTHPSDRSHLCPLNCHFIFSSYKPGLTSMQHTTSHTTAVQSPSHYQWYILIGKQWYQLPEFFSIQFKSNSGLNSCNSISTNTQHVTK